MPENNSSHKFNVTFLMTHACNLHCSHCYLSAGNPLIAEASTQDTFKIIDELINLGVSSIIISGGEPFCRKDWRAIFKYINDHGVEMSLETNGTLLNTKAISFLKSLEFIGTIAISIDGITPMSYARLRGDPNILPIVLDSTSKAAKAGLDLQVITVLNRFNVDEMPLIYDFTTKIGAELRILPEIQYGGRGKNIQNLNLTPKGILDFARDFVFKKMIKEHDQVKRCDKKHGLWKYSIHIHLPLPFMPFELPPFSFTCDKSKVLGVFPDGNVGFCYRAIGKPSLIYGNVLKESLTEIQKRTKLVPLRFSWKQDDYVGVCRKCRAFRACKGGCRLSALEYYGQTNASDPVCQTFYEAGLFPEYAIQ